MGSRNGVGVPIALVGIWRWMRVVAHFAVPHTAAESENTQMVQGGYASSSDRSLHHQQPQGGVRQPFHERSLDVWRPKGLRKMSAGHQPVKAL
jgi:hypothetical protein